MSRLTKFQYFPDLPRELQNIIWDFYRNQRGLRHYITVLGNQRFYASIDIDTNQFMHTYVSALTAANQANSRWPESHPASKKKFNIINLIGQHGVPEAGSFAKSIVTTKEKELALWTKRHSLHIRCRFEDDVFFFDGSDTGICLRPMSHLSKSTLLLEPNHWLRKVRHLAIQLRPVQSNLDNQSKHVIVTLPKLKNLYLVVYRDPQCVYGAPRNWRHFKKDMMDEHNFLPFETFSQLHAEHPGKKCICAKMATGAESVQRRMRRVISGLRGLVRRHHVDIKIVVDPY
ncbi:hypothetical protein F4776DRAFT_660253 [Hypoxylon sp. NC0597]|nr:hypothetical protein F4776DRAFT_660253 [Hypoxylon sp. NC0597]